MSLSQADRFAVGPDGRAVGLDAKLSKISRDAGIHYNGGVRRNTGCYLNGPLRLSLPLELVNRGATSADMAAY